jgi:hypothetical protein
MSSPFAGFFYLNSNGRVMVSKIAKMIRIMIKKDDSDNFGK